MDRKHAATGPKPSKKPYVYTATASLVLFGICLLLLRGCYQSQWDQLKAENDELRQEIQGFKEQAVLADQRCENLLAQNQCGPQKKPKKSVAMVVPKLRKPRRKAVHPGPTLAQRQAEVAAVAKQAPAVQKKEAPPEEEPECGGEPIDYETFASSQRGGLSVGKRYCFNACISMTPCLGGLHDFNGTVICNLKMDFDDSTEQEGWIKTRKVYCGQIVASGNDRSGVSIHRLH